MPETHCERWEEKQAQKELDFEQAERSRQASSSSLNRNSNVIS